MAKGIKDKVVMFDIDGTLVFTAVEHRRILVRESLKRMSVKKVPSDKSIERFWFDHGRTEYIHANYTPHTDEFWRHLIELDTPEFRLQHTKPFPDVGVLRALKRDGYRFGVVTSATPSIADAQLKLIGREMFDVVVNATHGSDIRRKPDPHGIEICLDRLGVKHKLVPYVGNAPEDVRAARAAGVPEVFVYRGEYRFRGMKALKPQHSIRNLNQLSGILANYHS